MNKFLGTAIALGVTATLSPLVSTAASYKIIDKETDNGFKHSYAQQVSNSGLMGLTLSQQYNPVINYERISEATFDAVFAAAANSVALDNDDKIDTSNPFPYLKEIEDFDALKAGNPTGNDLSWLLIYLKGQNSPSIDLAYQQFAETFTYVNRGASVNELVLFDEVDPELNALSRNAANVIHGVNNNDWVFGEGSAPYKKFTFVDSSDVENTYWLRDFSKKAFVSLDGSTIKAVEAIANEYGGISSVIDINENNVAVGYASVEIDEDVKAFIEKEEDNGCRDPERLADQPFESCVNQVKNSSALYKLNAVKWQLDSQGNVVSAQNLGGFTDKDDAEIVFQSQAHAINNNGVVVGVSAEWRYPERDDRADFRLGRANYAFVYKNEELHDITDQEKYREGSSLLDINDEGIAVGYFRQYINGTLRRKVAYVDTNTEDMQPVFPTDFFLGSDSLGRAINENGIIVGDGEVEIQNTGQRRREAFMYNIATNTFVNLNSLIACNSPYTIVEARGINDNNQIAANAVIEVPRRNAKGEIILDENGKEYTESVVRAVLLDPIAGEPEDCSASETKVEREGASIYYLLSLILLSLGFRRK